MLLASLIRYIFDLLNDLCRTYARLLYNRLIIGVQLGQLNKRNLKMVDGWRPVVIPDEIFEVAKEHYEEHKEELKLKDGVRSLTGFINFCIREYLKEQGII